jgi:hypothetical protein
VVLWDLPHEHAIVQPWGAPKTKLALRQGRILAPRASRGANAPSNTGAPSA